MKRLLVLLLIVICYNSFGQSRPAGLPTVKSDSGFYQIGYIFPKVLSGLVIGDTAIRPSQNGSIRLWFHAGVDTAIWAWKDTKWFKIASSGGGGGGATDTANLSYRIDTIGSKVIEVIHPLVAEQISQDTTLLYFDSTYFNQFLTGVDTLNLSYRIDTIAARQSYCPSGFLDGLVPQVSWIDSLKFEVTAGGYFINCGGPYFNVWDSVTLSAADATLNRIDVIAVDVNGAVVVIEGDPATTPSAPQVDPTTQLYLTQVYVPAASTVPQGVTITVVYDEDLGTPSEFNTTFTGSWTAVSNATNNPYHLAKNIDASTYSATKTVTFTTAPALVSTDYSLFKMFLSLKAAMLTTSNVTVRFFNGTVAVTPAITLSATYGFSKTTSGYQNITIPFSAIPFSSTTFTNIRIAFTGTGTGFYMDYVQLQGGIPNGLSNFLTSVFRKTGTDSVFQVKNGIPEFAYKDSIGTGGGSGSGISEVVADYGLLNINDSTLRVDTFAIATRARLQKVADSLQVVNAATYVPLVRTITINGVTFDLSADRTWTVTAGSITGGAALTKTDDTNVTLTLGGSPTTALLAATSMTLGWTGVLSIARGGTNNGSLSVTNGGLAYFDGTKMVALPIGTAAQHLVVVGGIPAWRDTAAASGGGGSAAGATGDVQIKNANGSFSAVSTFHYDSTNAALGLGTATPNASSILDIPSTTKGVLIPRMTDAQVNLIGTPATGLLAYNTTNTSFSYYNGAAWVSMGNGWLTTGNTGTTTSNFTGTLDSRSYRTRTNNVERMIVDSVGKVGIGITVPTSYFHVVGKDNGEPIFGAELFTASNWTLNSGWSGTWAAGFAHAGGGGTAALTNTFAAVVGTTYKLVFTVSGRTAGTFQVTFGGGTTPNISASADAAIAAISTATFQLIPTSTFDGTVIISMKAVTGNSIPLATFSNSNVSAIEMRSDTLTNTFIGTSSGARNIAGPSLAGQNNTGFGANTLAANTTGTNNTALGTSALAANIAGGFNTAFGINTLLLSKGDNNTALGANASAALVSGLRTTAVGTGSLIVSTGSDNTALGYNAGAGNTSGSFNTFIGLQTNSGGAAGTGNTAVGAQVMQPKTGTGNTGLGYQNFFSKTSGDYNTSIGYQNMYVKTGGGYNISIGSFVQVPTDGGTGELNIGNVIYGDNLYQTAVRSSTPTTNGRIGIGLTTPTARLMLPAGTATASTAPLKFTAGIVLTTPESGVMETNANNELIYSTSTTAASRGFVGLGRYAATATSLTANTTHSTIDVTATGQTITLPTAVGIQGRVYTIKLTASGSGTVATTSSQTIDGSTTYSLASQYKYVIVQSDNANWIVIGNN